jgi:hypothetical protein
MNPWKKPTASGQPQPQMPREQQKALADLARFDRLKKFPAGFAASENHLPELAHSPATLEALARDGLAVVEKRPNGDAVVTDKGKARHAAIEAERFAEAVQ